MIFPRIGMWGNLSNLEPKGGKTHVLSSFVLTNHFQLIISAGSWGKLWQLMVLGVGWQDCQSMPTPTLHHSSWLHNVRKNLHALPIWPLTIFHAQEFSWVLPTRFSPANLRPLHCCAFSRRGIPSRFSSSRTEPSGFHPCSFFPRGFADDVVVSTPHRLIMGSALLLTLIHRLGDCNFFPSVVCICFLGDLVPRMGFVFPRCWLWLLWYSLHVGDYCKFTWESFWPW